ncbi:hypothetical protein CEUSTIGMA_g8478.t1 [Chlamydomonas eustigma]|uniref:G domain-containing protein n=1 Tax=Chlamydomonas eustigma TaxID=1157962 RepID=A0A250XD79_9CHLO|nr:hypothetical protein CEUSTIGMA_g8478.t1 [Chlamydomonas eustigma]|eukprot:GAX81043.1 hypothetical protein CEUSTIGMA_g8478.t1 [Chlamydomonas eustigma]
MVKTDELSVQEHMLPCSTRRLSVQNETMYKDESLETKVKVKSKKKRAASSEIVVDEPWHKGPPEEETARLVKCIQGLIFPSQQSIHPDVDLKQDLSAITQHQVLNLLEDEVLNGHHQDAHIGQRLAVSSTTNNTIMNVTPVLSLSGLNHLCSELLLPARASGLLPNLPLDVLKHMLLALRTHMAPGSECSLDSNSLPDEVALVQSALDSAMAALYVLSCPGMPSEVYLEEMIEQIILVIKHNLQHNVMVFYESRFARLWRPSLLPEGSVYSSSETKSAHIKKIMGKGGRSSNYDASSAFYTTTDQQGAPPHVLPMLQRLEQATSLLSETLGQARLEACMLLPLVRVALQTLTVESLKVYQVKAVGLTVAVFKHVPSLRQVIMDELISSLVPSLLPVGANKAPKRLFLVEGPDGDQSGKSSSVQMIVSLVTQLVQDVAEMPASNCGAKAAYERCGLPVAWADRFWTGIMDRLPAAKAAKADTSSDLKAFLEDFINGKALYVLLADLFVLHHLPDWPAAALLLRRLVVQLNTHRGLKHSEAAVKLMSIDFLGAVAAKLIAEYQTAEGDEGDVERMWRRAKAEMARRREGSRTELSPEGSDREDDAVALSSPGANSPPERSIQHEVISPLKSQGCHDILQQLLIHHVRMHGQGSAPYRLAHSSRGELLGGGSAAGGAGRKGHWEHAGNLRAVLMLRDKLVEEARMVSSESDADAADKQSNADHKPGQQQQHHKGLDGISQERAMELNLEHRMLLDPGLGEGLISTSVLPDISRREAVMLGRWLVANGALGKARGTLLKWLVDAGDKSSQDGSAANVRAKAVKSIGAAIEVDVRILSLADVQGAVRDALHDDSVMVREAAIDLIGRPRAVGSIYVKCLSDRCRTFFDSARCSRKLRRMKTVSAASVQDVDVANTIIKESELPSRQMRTSMGSGNVSFAALDKSLHVQMVQWYPGHIAKAERQLKEQLSMVDVVLEIRDARIISSTSHPQVPTWVGSKPRVLVINRADSIQPGDRKQWSAYFQRQGIKAFWTDGKLGAGVSPLRQELLNASVSINEKRARRSLQPRPVRACVIGFPNIGKSALINRLLNRRVVDSAPKPGVTRMLKWVRLGGKLDLLDAPGVIPASFNDQIAAQRLAMCNDIGEAAYVESLVASALIVRCKTLPGNGKLLERLQERYKIDPLGCTAEDFVQGLADKLFFGDRENAGVRILKDFRNGALGSFALELPPETIAADGGAADLTALMSSDQQRVWGVRDAGWHEDD